ncbi:MULTISPECIES: YybH family protein [Aquimarina]|uniref:Nuclear transport factor 2 family protein n=1 Tax=Aquimarina algiphila TaxID=2047982 RepID=A0A554VDP1_9FLAO|nr:MULTISPECIES: nuclear transport factor 2 family protein [Aquimarina]TSE05038.1 nuclear transport factor 2 family protein [Aquimarina algiphila]
MNTEIKRKAMRPRDIANHISECIKEGDLENIVDFFHPDYIMSFPPSENPKSGLDTIREVFGEFIASKSILSSEVTGEIINGDTALLQATWTVTDISDTIIAEGKSTEVIKQRIDGSWVYFIDCPMGLPKI